MTGGGGVIKLDTLWAIRLEVVIKKSLNVSRSRSAPSTGDPAPTRKGADEQAAAGDLFPPIYSAAFPERESQTRGIIMQSGLFDLSREPLHVPTVFTAERAASLRTQEKETIPQDVCGPGTLPCAEAYWWQLSDAAIITRSDAHIRKVSHVVALITQRLRGQKDRSAETFGISCGSSRFLFVLTGEKLRR